MTAAERFEQARMSLQQIASYARAGATADDTLSREKTLRAILEDIAIYAERKAQEGGQ